MVQGASGGHISGERTICSAAPAEPLLPRLQDAFSEARQRPAECPPKMGRAGDLELLYGLVRCFGARRVVETGVAYGWSSLAILLALSYQGDLVRLPNWDALPKVLAELAPIDSAASPRESGSSKSMPRCP